MARETIIKSVVTCDMEGRIETISEGSVAIFGYQPEELIGKKRVSIFSPGQVVLEHVPGWLKTASEEGEYVGETVFVDKNGDELAAKIRITPTFKDNQQIGYCGVTEVLPTVEPQEVAQEIGLFTKIFQWLVITRAPFLTAMIVPILIGGAWVAYQGAVSPYPTLKFWLALAAGILLHVAANVFNDYFDWQSGTDQANNDYFLPFTGGSRSLELGLIEEKGLFRLGFSALLVSGGIGVYLALTSGFGVFAFGLIGAFLAYFYTAPPLRLAARKGMGELVVGLSFGPLATAGTVYAITGQVSLLDFIIGVPIGLLTIAILWINQFPDEDSDRETGKLNLVVVLGKERARWGYLALVVLSFGLLVYLTVAGSFPATALLALLVLPLGLWASLVTLREYGERTLVRANVATIQLHTIAGLLMAAGILWSSQIAEILNL